MVLTILEKLGVRFTLDADFISKIILSLNIKKEAKILDIGTGWGKMSIILALHGYEVTTGEPEKWSDWEIYAKQAGVLEKIHYQEMDAQQLNFEDKVFEFIFLLGSLHHIPDKKRAFSEFLRILHPEGRIILFDYTDKRVAQIKKRIHHHPPEIKLKEILNEIPVTYKQFIDEKKEIFCYIIQKN